MTQERELPTPRTDALIVDIGSRHIADHVDDFNHYFDMASALALHARTLERELAQSERQNFDHRAAIGALERDLAAANAALAECRKDAARYQWLRSRDNSLERGQHDKGINNGVSCYHMVGGVRELKHGEELDAAIDAALLAQSEGKSAGQERG